MQNHYLYNQILKNLRKLGSKYTTFNKSIQVETGVLKGVNLSIDNTIQDMPYVQVINPQYNYSALLRVNSFTNLLTKMTELQYLTYSQLLETINKLTK